MGEYVSRFHRIENQQEARSYEMLAQLEELGLNDAQFRTAISHPIYFEVIRLALLEVPIITFWAAQYKWLGIDGESISKTGIVQTELKGTSFAELSRLRKKMWDEAPE